MRIVLATWTLVALAVVGAYAQLSESAVQELTKVENAWNAAVINRDAAALQRLYADEYLSTDADGAIWTKAQDISNVTSGTATLTAAVLDDLKVRRYANVAVVTGRNTVKGTFAGKDISGPTRFTDVFVLRDGRWQCVATQFGRITNK
jgi:ketosteroid isomerase-like protein